MMSAIFFIFYILKFSVALMILIQLRVYIKEPKFSFDLAFINVCIFKKYSNRYIIDKN